MEKRDKIYLIVAIAFMLAVVVADICYIMVDCSQYITKTIASALFVLCGAFNLVYVIKTKQMSNRYFKWFMMLGLIFGALGDILLIDNFIIGTGLFALGHVFYVVAYCLLTKFNWKDLLFCIGAMAASLLVILLGDFNFDGMLPVVIIYAIIISAMLGKALGLLFTKKLNTLTKVIIIVGSCFFFFSDLMLLFNVFGAERQFILSVLCLATYYPAQVLLATSIYLVSKNTREAELAQTKASKQKLS